jgi:UPF0271 protein
MPPTKNSEKDVHQVAYILDASAIFNGILDHNLPGIKYVPDCVLEEIQGMHRGEAFLEEIRLSDNLIITLPEEKNLSFIRKTAIQTGDIDELSNCDLTVLALAFDLLSQKKSVQLLSDDYDIQNLAEYLDIPCKGIHWKGIKWVYEYRWICQGCGFKSNKPQEQCIECGTEMIKKRYKRKRKTKK